MEKFLVRLMKVGSIEILALSVEMTYSLLRVRAGNSYARLPDRYIVTILDENIS